MESNGAGEIVLEPGDMKRAIAPLRLVFWGGILCVLDVRFNGFDLFNDVVGALLIAWGVFRLGGFQVHDRYRLAMRFVQIMSLMYIAAAVNAYLHYDEIPRSIAFLLHLYGIAKMAATVVFCVAMRWLCLAAGLTRSQRSWKTTTILFTVVYLVPWGLLHLVWIGCIITGKSFNVHIGLAVLLVLVIFAVPLIHLFVSTSRMRREAASIPARADAIEGVGAHPWPEGPVRPSGPMQ